MVEQACAGPVQAACPKEAFPSSDLRQQEKCVSCIKENVGAVMRGGGSFSFGCSLADVGNICAVSEKGRSKEETVACETELKKYCKKAMIGGPKCVKCVKEHLQRIDGALAGNSMCSKFQLEHFCFFSDDNNTSAIVGGEYPSGLEKRFKEKGLKVPGQLDDSEVAAYLKKHLSSASTNTQTQPCGAGTFSFMQGDCKDMSVCDPTTEYIAEEGTATSDRVCAFAFVGYYSRHGRARVSIFGH